MSASEADRQLAWAGLLRRIIEITAEDLDRREVVQRVAALVIEATGADVCFVHLVDEERNVLVLTGATPPFDQLAGTIELAIGEGVSGWVAQHGTPLVVDDKWSDPRYKYIPALKGEDYASLVSLPLIRQASQVVGVVNVHSRERRDYAPDELALLVDVAGLLAGIVDNARLYTRLTEREAELERFAARTIELQEVERRRVAADIHDGISQRLVSLWYHLSAAENAGPDGVVAEELAAAKTLADAALEEARRTILGLRPAVLDDLGLGPGLESLASDLPGVELDVAVDPRPLPAHIETALFRIAQEALQNVAKHAGAEHVRVALSHDARGARLTVVDDGAGFDPDPPGAPARHNAFGLVGMQERAALLGGRVTVTSAPGKGTNVTAEVPLPSA